MRKISLFHLLIFTFIALPNQGFAQDPSDASASSSVIYETPTIAKLSRLYWALEKFEMADDPKAFIDNYLKINECDLYKNYAHNEFEWENIKNTTYEYIQKNKRSFDTHFSLVQPLYLTEYDMKKGAFEILDEFKIANAKNFEARASDFNKDLCGSEGKEFYGYPQSLYVELSRPFNLEYLPLSSEEAQRLIKEKTPYFTNLTEKKQTKENLYLSRDVYMVMKIKVFTYKEDIRTQDGYTMAKVLGVLDRYEIYQDRELKTLLYAQDLNIKKPRSQDEIDLKKQYQERLKKKMQEKHAKPADETAPTEPAPAASP